MGEDNSYYEKTLATGAVRCIDDEIPFEIPSSWAWCRLEHIIDFSKSQSIKNDDINKDAWLLDLEDIEKDTGKLLRKKRMKDVNAKSDKHPFEKGNVLYSKLRPYLNKVIIADEDGVCTSEILAFDFTPIFNRYAQVYLMSPFFVEHAMSDAYGVKMPRLGSKQGNAALMPIPPITEQIRIVDRIDAITPLVLRYSDFEINLNRLNSSITDILKKSILQEAIQGKLVPQIESEGTAEELLAEIQSEKMRLVKEGKLKKSAIANESRIFRGDDNKYYEQIGSNTLEISDEIPFEIPTSWRWCRIGCIFQINPKNDVRDDSEAAFVPMEAINPGYGSGFTYQLTKWNNIKRGYTHFADGDIAFAKITPCFQNRKSVIFQNLPSGIGAGTTELKVLRPLIDGIWKEYVLAFLQSPYFIDEATFKGTANQQRIISGYVETKLFPLPPYEEQKRIAKKIQGLYEMSL